MQQSMHCGPQRGAEGLNESFARMAITANFLPGVLEALKYEVGAVYERAVQVK